MSSGDHRHLREALGAYVLGALEPAERRSVERHLDDCATCRDELARLSPLPPLLDRLDVDEVVSPVLRPPEDLVDRVVEAIVSERRHTRRRLRMWQGLAAAAALLGVLVTWAPWQGQPAEDAVLAPAQPVVASVQGEAELMAWDWGTTVRLDVRELPVRDGYLLWAVARDGRREQAGTWGPTADRRARVIGASAIQRERLARVEITDPEGEVLAVFEPPRT